MINQRKKILIIDGNNLVNRCLYSMKELGFYNGKKKKENFIYTGMQYGTIKSLIGLNDELEPDQILIVWDGGSHRRLKIYPKYKWKRKDPKNLEKFASEDSNKPSHDFIKEVIQTRNILSMMGICQIRISKEEADDVIGTIVRKQSELGNNIIISSNDHDFYQLLRYKNVKVYRNIVNGKYILKQFVTKRKFIKKFGFDPKYYQNMLTLAGDQTDNYPGVKGIGEKTAIKLILNYGPTLKNIIKNAMELKIKEKRLLNLISTGISDIQTFLKIAKIYTEIKGIDNPENYNLWKLDKIKLKEEFKKLRFHSLLFKDKIQDIKRLSKKQYSII